MKPLQSFIIISAMILGFNPVLGAIQLIYKDYKGHYHYRCTDKTGGKTIVAYRAEGVFIDGPTGQQFIPLDSAAATRSEKSVKITERFARMGCRERLTDEELNIPYR